MKLIHSVPVLLLLLATMATAADKTIDPATLKDKVTIEVGKKLSVQFDQTGDALSAPRVVAKAVDKPPTVNFEFRKQDASLILMTKNPFKKDLKFRALMRLKGRKTYEETSIVPVKAGLFSLELWKDPIEQMVLFDFKLVDGQ